MNKDSIFETVKNSITMRETAELMGFEPKHGFICCPFHAENTPSMKLYGSDFHCFGCQAHGDVIEFVRRVRGYSRQIDAARELARTAGLTIEPYKPVQTHSKPAVPSAGQVAAYLDKWERRAFRAALWGREQCSSLLRTYSPDTVDDRFHDLLTMRERCERLMEEMTAGTVAPTLQERGELYDYWNDYVDAIITKFDWGDAFEQLDRNFRKPY